MDHTSDFLDLLDYEISNNSTEAGPSSNTDSQNVTDPIQFEFGIHESPRERLVEDIFRTPLRRRLCHDILPVDDRQDADRYVTLLQERRYYGQLLIVSYHNGGNAWEHLHVVHDCGWTAGTCRCVTFAGLPFQRRRRAIWTGGISREYVYNLAIYLFLPPRHCLYYLLSGTRREIRCTDEIDSVQTGKDGTERTIMDENDEISSICSNTAETATLSNPHSTSTRRTKRNSNTSKSKKNQTITQILAFFERHPVCPLLSSCKTVQWMDNPDLQSIGRNNSDFMLAADIFQRKICNMKITEIIEMYLRCEPLFACTSGHVFEYYYSLEESIAKLYQLIEYQCNYDQDVIVWLLQTVYNILDRVEEKKNCLQILGPSNAGKTLFAKLCASLCLVKGQIANFNKYCQFPLQDCIDKRILIWDEPNCEAYSFETCKMLFAGDPCMANIKYQSHVQIDRTPIIITTNVNVFPNNEIFSNRMYKLHWHTAPFLSECTKAIYPLALYELWKRYGIITTIQSVS